MGAETKIEWAHHTFNPWIGCQKVSPGCDHCYAERQNAHRKWNGGTWGPHAPRKRTSDAYWRQPIRWNKVAGKIGKRHRVFCASLADWLDNKAPQSWRVDLAELIRETPNLDWLLLTKRPENYNKLAPWNNNDFPENIWLGMTAEDQFHYETRWRHLSRANALVRFVSYEPAIGPLIVPPRLHPAEPLPDWIICGGESGPLARHMQPSWARALREQCTELGIAFFMKQMTRKEPIPDDLLVRQTP